MRFGGFLAGLALAVPVGIVASTLTIPHAFTNNTVADAAQVNQNFGAVKGAVDDNATRIAALEAKVAALEAADANRPAFSVYLTSAWTTNGATIKFTGSLLNNGNHYNATTGEFTAPSAGVYRFCYGGIKASGSTTQVGRMHPRKNGANLSAVTDAVYQARASEGATYGFASPCVNLALVAGDKISMWNSDLGGWYDSYSFFSGSKL